MMESDNGAGRNRIDANAAGRETPSLFSRRDVGRVGDNRKPVWVRPNSGANGRRRVLA
jgi:hypothetical protein